MVEDGPEKGLFVRNAESQPFVIDRRTGQPAPWDGKGVEPDLGADWQGNRTVFQHMAERYLAPDYAPEAVADALRHRRPAHPRAGRRTGTRRPLTRPLS